MALEGGGPTRLVGFFFCCFFHPHHVTFLSLPPSRWNRWSKGGVPISEANGDSLEVTVDHSYFTDPVSCEVSNSVGSTNVSTLVDVQCKCGHSGLLTQQCTGHRVRIRPFKKRFNPSTPATFLRTLTCVTNKSIYL